jgi:hypothetical protein
LENESREYVLALRTMDEIYNKHREILSSVEDRYERKGIDPEIINLVVNVYGCCREMMLDFAARYVDALRGDNEKT